MENIEYQKASEENAMGSSLEIIKSSGDEIFGKIYKIQMPQSSNAIGSSLGSLKTSEAKIRQKVSRSLHETISSIKTLSDSGKQLFSRLPKFPKSSNAIGSSLEAINTSSSEIIKKILDLGKKMLSKPVKVLPNVKSSLEELSKSYKLILIE